VVKPCRNDARAYPASPLAAVGCRWLGVVFCPLFATAPRNTGYRRNLSEVARFAAGDPGLAAMEARMIHTVRDPVDTCLSCFSKLFVAKQNHTYDLGELGGYFRHYQQLMAHWHRVLPASRILDVRYEDVVTDLEGQARRLIAHCGLDWDPRCLAFHQTERPVRTASATQVRQPIYNGSIGRWRVYAPFLRPLLAELAAGGGCDSDNQRPHRGGRERPGAQIP
jgi:hypothetical protein